MFACSLSLFENNRFWNHENKRKRIFEFLNDGVVRDHDFENQPLHADSMEICVWGNFNIIE